jgi:hypothetical protein
LILLISTAQFGPCQQNSQPLSDSEKRQVLGQLLELKSCRQESAAYEKYVEREQAQDVRERANYERSLELERQAAAIEEKERDLYRDRAAFYEQAFRSVMKKPGRLCRLARILTFGIARCE